MVPVSLLTLRCLLLRLLVTGIVWSPGFFCLSTMGPQCPSVVVRRLPSVRRSSLGCGPTRSLSLLVSSVLAWGLCSRRPPSFRLVVSSRLALSICHRVLLAFLSAVPGFLSSLRSRSVAFSSGSTALASLRGAEELFPGLSLFCAFGLPLFGSFPSCSVSQVSSPLGKCLRFVCRGFLLRRSFP